MDEDRGSSVPYVRPLSLERCIIMQAIRLFGGKRAVINRMTTALRKRLAGLSDEHIAILEEAFFF